MKVYLVSFDKGGLTSPTHILAAFATREQAKHVLTTREWEGDVFDPYVHLYVDELEVIEP